MSVIVLCEFSCGAKDTRSWLLKRIALLAIEGGANLQFVATDDGVADVVAVRFADSGLARTALSHWQADPAFAAMAKVRTLRADGDLAGDAAALFP